MTKSIKKFAHLSFFSLFGLSMLAVTAFYAFRLPPSPLSANKFRGQEIAHRGGYELGPENTISTIVQNLRNGVTAFEVDVQLSKDGFPVLFHDSTLTRLTGHPGNTEDLTLVELKTLPLLDRQGKVTGMQMASLEELLDTLDKIAPLALLELDLKFYGDNQDLLLENTLDLVERYQAKDRVLFSSFDPRLIYKLRKMDTEVLTGYAHTKVSGEGRLMDFLLNLSLVPKFLGVAAVEPQMELADLDYVDYWTRRGLVINAWTANTAADKDRLRQLGVTLTTNCPFINCEDREEDKWGNSEQELVSSEPARGIDVQAAESNSEGELIQSVQAEPVPEKPSSDGSRDGKLLFQDY